MRMTHVVLGLLKDTHRRGLKNIKVLYELDTVMDLTGIMGL